MGYKMYVFVKNLSKYDVPLHELENLSNITSHSSTNSLCYENDQHMLPRNYPYVHCEKEKLGFGEWSGSVMS